MTLYTYGGTASDVLTDASLHTIPDYPVIVRVAGTGAVVTALLEADGITPIAQLRSNPATSDTPGAIRTFKIADVPQIEYEYNGVNGLVRWYQAARETAQQALAEVEDKLSRSEGGTVNAAVALAGGATVSGGLAVTGGATVDDLDVTGTLTAEGGVSLAGMRIYNPRLYGALGDGIHDDAPAVQQALGDAYAAGGGWVLVPPGDYRLSSLPLRIRRNTRFTLLPGARMVRGTTGTMLLNGDAEQNMGGYSGHGNITIEGGEWDARATSFPTSAMCLSIGHAENVTIRDTTIRDVCGYHGIEVNAVKNAKITNVRGLGYLDPGGRDFSEFIQPDLAKSSGAFGGFGPYDNSVCRDVEISGCYVGASGTAGTTAWPRGVGSHSATVGTAHKRIKITGCTFEGLPQYAIVAYAWDDSVITKNTIVSCGAGIRARTIISADAADSTDLNGTVTNASQPMRNLTVNSNIIRTTGSMDDAILLYGETTGRVTDATINGNVIDGVGGAENGIRIYYAEQYTAGDNTVRDTGGTAISQEQVIGATVSDNRLYQPGAVGISCDTGQGVSISDNSIRNPGTNGIHVLAGADIQVENNFIKGASRSAAGNYGIRISSGLDGLKLTGNKVRKFGSGPESIWGVSITNSCTSVTRWGNDVADSGTTGSLDDQSTQPNTSPLDLMGNIESLTRPPGRYETTSRLRAGTSSTPTSGSLYLVPLWLPKGFTVSSLAFVSGGTAGASLTNWWFTLHNNSKVALARTADQTTAAWPANTAKSLPIAQTTAGTASSYTTTYTGLHYIGVMIKATTVPSLVSEGSVADILASVSPGFGGTDTALTTPPTVSGTGFTAGSFGAGSGVLLYAYAT